MRTNITTELRSIARRLLALADRMDAERAPDLFTQPAVEEPEEAALSPISPVGENPISPEIPGYVPDGYGGYILIHDLTGDISRRVIRRLKTKMVEARTLRAGEPLGRSAGYHQRMNIEAMILRRTGADREAVREAFNRAVEELRPVCVLGRTPKGRKMCRFYSSGDRDLLVERSINLLNA